MAFNTAYKWLSRAGTDVEYILSVDIDEIGILAYQKLFDGYNVLVNSNRSAVDAINNAAKVCTGDIIVVMSDDFDCPKNWDIEIIEKTKGKSDWIAKTPDGIQKWIITLPIMDRIYYNRFGYIYHPDYIHMFCDTELTCVADLTGRKIELNIPFVHNHYSTGKSIKDEISIKADATWQQGEKLFIERYKNNFGLTGELLPIQSQEYKNWIKWKI